MYFHQGGHGGEPPMALMNRWFTRYLLGVQNGVERDPRAWVVREGANRLQPTPYPDWPNPAAAAVTLHPGRGGSTMGALAPAAPGGQGAETLTDDVAFTGAQLARAATSPHRLLYATPVLTAPVHLSGTARVSLTLSANRPATNLSVWLVELPFPDSTVRAAPNGGIITRGWADPQNARSLRTSEPLVPGRPVTVTFDLEPDDQVIPAGKRIGLLVLASDREFTLWPAPGTQLTVDLDRSSLSLPVVGGRAALRW
jgi:X-Pro dipeptidyl-peptidase